MRIGAKVWLYAAWSVALGATVGSLILSEMMHLVPCSLCWYQRIFMYSLVPVLAVGIMKRDEGVTGYALPLAIAGATIAAYHSLLQWGVIKEALTPCQAGIACATPQINWLGFITIPFMSLVSFVVVIAGLLLYSRLKARN